MSVARMSPGGLKRAGTEKEGHDGTSETINSQFLCRHTIAVNVSLSVFTNTPFYLATLQFNLVFIFQYEQTQCCHQESGTCAVGRMAALWIFGFRQMMGNGIVYPCGSTQYTILLRGFHEYIRH